MRYGVKHYPLKPSNETEITQVIVSCVETCKSKTASRVDSPADTAVPHGNATGKTFAEKIFHRIIRGTGCGSGQDPDDPSGNGGLQEGILPAQQTADHRQSHAVNVCVTMNDLIPCAEQIMTSIFSVEPQHKYTDCVEKVIKYIREHLSDSNLSLKWISKIIFL